MLVDLLSFHLFILFRFIVSAKHSGVKDVDNKKNDEDGNFNEREFLIQNPQLIPLNPLLIIDR